MVTTVTVEETRNTFTLEETSNAVVIETFDVWTDYSFLNAT